MASENLYKFFLVSAMVATFRHNKKIEKIWLTNLKDSDDVINVRSFNPFMTEAVII